MTLPQYPNPGVIPLRPLAIGEVLGAGMTIVRRNVLPLGGVAVLVALLSTAVTLGTLAATGALEIFIDATWWYQLLQGATTLPAGMVVATLMGLLLTTIGGPIVAGMAAAYAGALALGRDGRGAVGERLRGRWPVLLGVAVIVGVLVATGLVLLIVPGVLAYLILVLAAPATVMERGSVKASLRRSAALTHGHRGRILGAVAITMIAGTLAGAVASGLAGVLIGQDEPLTGYIVSQLASTVVDGLASAWTGAVVAVLYIDIRIRAEHLDQALRTAAAADRNINPPKPPGF